MKQRIGWVVAVACVGAWWAAPASAAPAPGAPACADGEALVTAAAPGWANAGASVPVAVSVDGLPSDVASLTVTLGGVATVVTPSSDEQTTVARVVAPRMTGPTQLVVTWDQGGTSATCSGRVELDVTVVPGSTRIGDTDAPHVDGRWLSISTPLNYQGRTETEIDRLRAQCDIGACPVRTPAGRILALGRGDRYSLSLCSLGRREPAARTGTPCTTRTSSAATTRCA